MEKSDKHIKLVNKILWSHIVAILTYTIASLENIFTQYEILPRSPLFFLASLSKKERNEKGHICVYNVSYIVLK